MRHHALFLAVVLSLSAVAPSSAEEGMWLPDAVKQLPLAQMRTHGLTLDPAAITGTNGDGLMSAVVLLGGGTGSFISPTGLILTNHHVAYGAIQALSTVEHDYLRDGFLAHNCDEELSIPTTAEIMLSMKDVTAEVLSAVKPAMPEAERTAAVQAKMRAIETEARGNTQLNCRVSEMAQGLQYALFTSLMLRDVRLVYAPPSSIGNFGGEIDNWIWPRHTGDFSILRAYMAPDSTPATYAKENIPYAPREFLPISSRGVGEGDFAMVMGFPGRTFRHREAAEIENLYTGDLPATVACYKLRIDAMTAATDASRAAQIKYASKIRRLANPYKKYVGILEGMRRADLPALRRREEQQFAAWIASSPERTSAYGSLLKEMEDAHASVSGITWKSTFLSNLFGVELLAAARRLTTWVEGFPRDSLDHVQPPTEDQKKTMREYFTDLFRNFDLTADREVMMALLRASVDLPKGEWVETLEKITGDRRGPDLEMRVREYVEALYEDTELSTLDGCLDLLNEDAETILDDPFVRLARQLGAEQTPLTARLTAYNAAIAPLRRRYVEAWMQWQPKEITYPDANRTLRLTYGTVQGLHPRDAVDLSFRTLLTGVMEKESTAVPFIVPDRLKELWQKKDFGLYAEKATGDVPVAFIADLDITGGNSGSPVINGRGELIGCAFDGNWESVVGDYLYQEEYNRSINVDARYVLFLLDKFAGATNILQELQIR